MAELTLEGTAVPGNARRAEQAGCKREILACRQLRSARVVPKRGVIAVLLDLVFRVRDGAVPGDLERGNDVADGAGL